MIIPIQTLAMISEQERAESKRRQAQGIAKEKGISKGKHLEYSTTARNSQKRKIYFSVVEALNNNMSISQITKEYGISRKTVYRIKNEI